MAFDVDDDIGADIASALSEVKGDAPAAPPAAAPEPAAPEAKSPAASGRDEQGRFASSPKDTAPAAEASQPAAGDAPEAVRPPASWSAQAKADFATLPPHIQAEVARREKDMDSGRAGFQAKAELANRFEELFASRRDRMAMQGVTPHDMVQRLLAAQDILERDPRDGLRQLAQAYGVDLRQLVGQPGQQQPQQAQLHPVIQQLMQEVNTLKGTLTQQHQLQQQAETQALQSTVQQFAADPKNLYYENVKGDMAALLRAGQAKDLADAYDKATWAHPDIRPLLLREQTAASQAAAQAAASAKVGKARSAAGSVVGSPAPGSTPAQQSNPSASVEDDVRAAFAAAGSRA